MGTPERAMRSTGGDAWTALFLTSAPPAGASLGAELSGRFDCHAGSVLVGPVVVGFSLVLLHELHAATMTPVSAAATRIRFILAS